MFRVAQGSHCVFSLTEVHLSSQLLYQHDIWGSACSYSTTGPHTPRGTNAYTAIVYKERKNVKGHRAFVISKYRNLPLHNNLLLFKFAELRTEFLTWQYILQNFISVKIFSCFHVSIVDNWKATVYVSNGNTIKVYPCLWMKWWGMFNQRSKIFISNVQRIGRWKTATHYGKKEWIVWRTWRLHPQQTQTDRLYTYPSLPSRLLRLHLSPSIASPKK